MKTAGQITIINTSGSDLVADATSVLVRAGSSNVNVHIDGLHAGSESFLLLAGKEIIFRAYDGNIKGINLSNGTAGDIINWTIVAQTHAQPRSMRGRY